MNKPERKDTIHYNYQMRMAGKLRTFEYVKLTESLFDSSKNAIDAVEIHRLIELTIKEILSSEDILLDEEIRLMISHYKIPVKQIKDLISNSVDQDSSKKIRELFKNLVF